MHKKLASELTSLAHSILQMKNKDNVFLLKKKAHEIYEKLSVLAYVEEYINTTPGIKVTKEELITKVTEAEARREEKTIVEIAEKNDTNFNEQANSFNKDLKNSNELEADDFLGTINNVEQIEEEITKDELIEQPFEDLENMLYDNEDSKFDETSFFERVETSAPTLEEELKDSISVDITSDLFSKVTTPKKSLNDRLQRSIQVGLNDRIGFVKHLFNGNASEFNRVLSQLNTFDTEKEAKYFINRTIKTDYDWSDKEEYETRFLEIIERKFS